MLSEENDLLKTRIYANTLIKLINNTPPDKVFTIGLFGNWGTGKSSIIETAKQELETDNPKINLLLMMLGNIPMTLFVGCFY